MAFEARLDTGNKKLYTGLTNVKVLHINPNKEELNELGYKTEEEPQYVSEKNGVKMVRIAVYVTDEKNLKTPINFYLTEGDLISTKDPDNNKVKVINAYGRTTWFPLTMEVPSNMNWYSTTGLRKTVKGEEEFVYEFLSKYLRTRGGKDKADQQCGIDNLNALFNGNFTELKQIPQLVPNNEIAILTGIKKYQDSEGNTKYSQTVYTRLFGYPKGKNVELFTKSVDEYNAVKTSKDVYYGVTPFVFTEVTDFSKINFEGVEADAPEQLATGTPAF